MSDPKSDARVFYNEDGDENNRRDRLTQEGLRMITRLVSQRGFKQLADLQEKMKLPEFDVEIVRDFEDMPDVAKGYQSEVAGDRVNVAHSETMDVKATGGSTDPALSFEDRDGDRADVDPDGIPFW